MHSDDEDQLAREAGHDRSNPSGIPDEGIIHEHEGQFHHLEKRPAPVSVEHHEEGHLEVSE